MRLRPAQPADLDRIMQILGDGRASLAKLGVDQWQGGYPQRALVARDIAHGSSYVVEEDGAVLATAMVGFEGERLYDRIDEGGWLTASCSAAPRYAVVHRVAVAQESRGTGVAHFLFGQIEAMARARGFESVRIETHPGNSPMRALLARRGFTHCGTTRIEHAEGGLPRRLAFEKLL